MLSWRLSVEALSEALARFGDPGVFNTDQGAQFTSDEFTKVLRDHEIEISMDGRGRCHDNIFVERLWWTVKHEWVYLRPAANGIEQKRSLAEFFDWYNPASSHPSIYAIEEKRFCCSLGGTRWPDGRHIAGTAAGMSEPERTCKPTPSKSASVPSAVSSS